jgi:undecaprenyl-diphosphatase
VSQLEALLLGLVQGLTEFLPVSSSGHLVMAATLLGIDDEGILFEVAVHVATLLAIVVFYRARVAALVGGALRGDPEAWRYVAKLALGTVPAVALVLVAGDFLESLFDAPAVTGVALLVTGGLLWTTRTTLPRARGPEPGWGAALLIGCAQALAIVPGISRSGATVSAALALGVEPLAAAEFSFLLGVVAIAGAALRMLPELGGVSPAQLVPMAFASAMALVSGLLALWLFVMLLRNQAFHRFALYLWPVGVAFLAWLALA